MKPIYYFLLLPLIFISCAKLDENPQSVITTDNFYTNESDATAAVSAVYSRMFTTSLVLYNRQLMMYEMATDDYTAGPRTRNAQVVDLSKLQHTSQNLGIEWSWRYSYDAINRANIAIDRIALIPADKIGEVIRLRLINEAKFLRAWNYFNLVRWHGDVPLVLHETTSLSSESLQVSQSPAADIYAQIIADLTAAEALPAPAEYGSADQGRATAGAAKTMLIKVYLTLEQWQKAADKAKDLIDRNWYSLFDSYADVFNVATKNGKEHIFSAQFKGNSDYTINMLAQYSAPTEAPFNGEFVDAPNTLSNLYASFSETDSRKYVTFTNGYTHPTTGAYVAFSQVHWNKYWDPSTPTAPTESSKNVPLLRYADVLLMYAEALNELGGPSATAYDALDKVRLRAQVPRLETESPGLDQTALRDAIFQERRKELSLEYHRWFDLARRGPVEFVKACKAAGKANAAPKHVHFPIPLRELNLNKKLVQLPDWN
ncbi:RagB/SusD family nutrient uptake outer membrane protein [Pedobacter sp. AW31-3R]|uniref:RagB/SusD family nutrient uptake outer membrane protein n=1 Tax=Pedobacter sp. AW31-3R TaxID=3445781 RepID=UPI003F9ED154